MFAIHFQYVELLVIYLLFKQYRSLRPRDGLLSDFVTKRETRRQDMHPQRLDIGLAMPDTILAAGLEAIVSKVHTLRFRAATVDELAAIARQAIAVLVLHLDLMGSQLAAWKSIRWRLPDLPCVFVVRSFSDRSVAEIVREGGTSFISEAESTPADTLEAIDAAAQSLAYLPPILDSLLLGDVNGTRQILSSRELEVLNLICRGLTDSEIAQQLILGRNSVKKVVKGILGKLGARNRTAAAVTAVTAGLASVPSFFSTAGPPNDSSEYVLQS